MMSSEKMAAEYGDVNAMSYRPDNTLDTSLDVDESDKTAPGPDLGPEHPAAPFAKGHNGAGTISNVVDIPWKYRIPAFCMILLWGTGASFADVTIGPLKSTLIKQLGINSESAWQPVGSSRELKWLTYRYTIRYHQHSREHCKHHLADHWRCDHGLLRRSSVSCRRQLPLGAAIS